jgi:predicted DNA-binding transcriptional regulator AlpA
MIDLLTRGSSPDDEACISVAELAKITGYTARRIYEFAEQAPDALPLDPQRKGIPASKVLAWLKARQVKRAARDAAVGHLREVAEATAGAKKDTNKGGRKKAQALRSPQEAVGAERGSK